jgi:hypothetical protein
MRKANKTYSKSIVIGVLVVLVITAGVWFLQPKVDSAKFEEVDLTTREGKTVANYFMEKLRMSPGEAREAAKAGTSFYVSDAMTLDALVSNLQYYGIVRDEEALISALEDTKDNVPGDEDAIKIGENSIDRGYYLLGPDMTAWEVADTLLNDPKEPKVDYGYMFMPGKPEIDDVSAGK